MWKRYATDSSFLEFDSIAWPSCWCVCIYGHLRWFRIPSLCNGWLVKHIIFGGRPSICLESAKGQGWYSVNRRGVFGWKSFILTCPGQDQFSGMTAERWLGQRKGISVLKTYIEWSRSKHSDSGVCFSSTPMQMFILPSSASGCSVAWCHEKGQWLFRFSVGVLLLPPSKCRHLLTAGPGTIILLIDWV